MRLQKLTFLKLDQATTMPNLQHGFQMFPRPNFLIRQLPSTCEISPNKYGIGSPDICSTGCRNRYFCMQAHDNGGT
jgi:hypothetical protein